jgi:hypothetical protein
VIVGTAWVDFVMLIDNAFCARFSVSDMSHEKIAINGHQPKRCNQFTPELNSAKKKV